MGNVNKYCNCYHDNHNRDPAEHPISNLQLYNPGNKILLIKDITDNEVEKSRNNIEKSDIECNLRENSFIENTDLNRIYDYSEFNKQDISFKRKGILIKRIQKIYRKFVKSKRIRNIVCIWPNSNVKYIGDMIGSTRNGFGIQLWEDKAFYSGMWKDNKANGLGRFNHSDGDFYIGEFAQDKANGFGLYDHLSGAVYEGNWLNDKQINEGFEIWKDKSFYQGVYKMGKKHGIGYYSWADGSSYEGEWDNNNLSGYGIYKFNDGRLFIGQWNDNRMHGYGEYHWGDGRKYVGYYNNDKKEGFGMYVWSNNRAYFGFWKDGKQNGIGKYENKGQVNYGQWEDGKRLKWFGTKEEAMNLLNNEEMTFIQNFNLLSSDIINFCDSFRNEIITNN